MKRLRATGGHCAAHFIFQQSAKKQVTQANVWAAFLLGVSARLLQAASVDLREGEWTS